MSQMNNPLPIHGIWRIAPSVHLAEIIAQSGFDFQILDCEHGPYSLSELTAEISVCRLNKCRSFVRVSKLDKADVQRSLDIGAEGIVFPGLRHYEDFREAVSYMDYAPAGTRGFNPFVRSGNYGYPDAAAPKRPDCITIIETLEAVEDLDLILGLDRIDMIYIGSYDLSAQLGLIGQIESPVLTKITEEIILKARQRQKQISLMTFSADHYARYLAKGVNAFVHSVDTFRIRRFFGESLSEYKVVKG